MGSRVLTLVVGGCAAGTPSTIIYKKCHLQDTSSREDTWSVTRDSSLVRICNPECEASSGQ